MKKLLSLPPNLVDSFHDVTGLSREEYFCTNDPVGHKLGSGGGTTWLLQACMTVEDGESLSEWLPREKRILLHAGGQSRRLPSYAPSGKILTPVPVFRWERGQRLSQDLLSLQLPLYEQMMQMAPELVAMFWCARRSPCSPSPMLMLCASDFGSMPLWPETTVCSSARASRLQY